MHCADNHPQQCIHALLGGYQHKDIFTIVIKGNVSRDFVVRFPILSILLLFTLL